MKNLYITCIDEIPHYFLIIKGHLEENTSALDMRTSVSFNTPI
jgi:hypothetical protein